MLVPIKSVVVLNAVAACLESRRFKLTARLAEKPSRYGQRVPAAGKRAGLASWANGLTTEIGKVYALKEGLKGEVDARVAALLVAVATGDGTSVRPLEDLLVFLGHPAAGTVQALPGWDISGLCRVLLS